MVEVQKLQERISAYATDNIFYSRMSAFDPKRTLSLMRHICWIVFIILVTGCSSTLTPEDVNATQLIDITKFPAEYRVAVETTAMYLKSKGEEPSEFHASNITQSSEIIILPLWHESAFKFDKNVVGNPGGKCRNIEYDTKSKRVIREVFWQ